MRPAKVEDVDYLQFLIAAQRVYTCSEAARCQPPQQNAPAHDAFTRLLQVQKEAGILVLDDTTLDKPHARKMALVTRHWSGKHQQVVMGINLLTLLWSDGNTALPCDCRLYDKPLEGGKTKNEHFQDMLKAAQERGFCPALVCFDSWYASAENLKLVRSLEWHFLTRLKSNRLVNPDGKGNVAVQTLSPPEQGQLVHLKEFGFVRLFRTVAPNGDAAQFWVTNRHEMTEQARQEAQRQAFAIENYHRSGHQAVLRGRTLSVS
jgi:putative transposase